ncbi:MAG: hypothetical protein JXR97_03740 [Planctomycetes bacterium]|nr:hypothetical protein [Planctomycetota bacterium]
MDEGVKQIIVPTVNLEGVDCPVRVGEDTAKLSLYLMWTDRDDRFEVMRMARKAAETGQEEDAIVTLGDREWKMSPKGAGGGKTGAPYMPYSMSMMMAPDIVLSLRDADYSQHCINGMVDIGSLSLMCQGSLGSVWQELQPTFTKIGAQVVRNVLSRVDITVDVANYPLEPFLDKLNKGHYIGGGTEDAEYAEGKFRSRKVPTGFFCSKKSCELMLRVYDKLMQIGTSEKEQPKREVLYERLGFAPTITRLEFEIHRGQFYYWNNGAGFLDGQINTVEDWHSVRATVLDFLMTDWIRYTTKEPDRENNHQSRAEEWDVWTAIREGAVQVLRNDNEIILPRPEPPKKDGRHLLAQALGCMTSYLAGYCPSGVDVETAKRCAKIFSFYAKGQKEHCEIKYRQIMKKLGREFTTIDYDIPF